MARRQLWVVGDVDRALQSHMEVSQSVVADVGVDVNGANDCDEVVSWRRWNLEVAYVWTQVIHVACQMDHGTVAVAVLELTVVEWAYVVPVKCGGRSGNGGRPQDQGGRRDRSRSVESQMNHGTVVGTASYQAAVVWTVEEPIKVDDVPHDGSCSRICLR